MALYSLVGQINTAPDFLPPEYPAPGSSLSTVKGNRAGTFLHAGRGSIRCDIPLIDDDAVIE